MQSYLQHVSLVEAELIALGGTERIKCHCLHADETSHFHWRARMRGSSRCLFPLEPLTARSHFGDRQRVGRGGNKKKKKNRKKENGEEEA